MTTQKHIIHKVKFNVSFGSKAEAMQGQQSFLQFFKKEISPALGALLDNYATPEELRTIKQLKIDLGTVSKRPDWKKLSRSLLRQLEAQLTKNAPDSDSGEKPRATLSKMEVVQDAILHYLEKGLLPTCPFDIQLEEDLLELLQQRPQQFLRALQITLSRSPEIVAIRLSRQLEAKTLLTLVEVSASAPQFQAFKIFFNALKSVALSAPQRWEAAAWQAILFSLLKDNPNSNTTATFILKDNDLPISFLPNFLKRVFSIPANPKTLEKEIRQVNHTSLHLALEEYLAAATSAIETPLESTTEQNQAKTKEPSNQGQKTESQDNKQVETSKEFLTPEQIVETKENPLPRGGLYSEMVGVVLLHPFLSIYFKDCGLLDEKGQFLSPATAEKGVFLLYFLATGKTQAKEHELAFQKIMCGLPLIFPLSNNIEITAEEIAEGEKLLNAAVNYWTALGKTSIAGLRESFLQRQGKISEGPEGWVLQVDRKTIDILIDKIPWNISLIQFSWLDRLLRVEWT